MATDLEEQTAYVELSEKIDSVINSPQTDSKPLWRTRKSKLFMSLSTDLQNFVGEFIGTFVLVLCSCTSTAVAVIVNALTGLWQVAVLGALSLGISMYLSAHISDAHLNPAVTVAFATVRFKAFSWKSLPVYLLAQFLGAFLAGGVTLGTFRHVVESFEEDMNIERGQNGSERSAMFLAEYFPNPALFLPDQIGVVSLAEAVVVEAWGTAVLVFAIFSLTDPKNTTVGSGRHRAAVPMLVGLVLGVLIALYAPLTQAGFNPARDFGPRLLAAMTGWGYVAIPGPRKGFWVYIIGPLIGGPIGGALYDFGAAQVKRLMKRPHT